MTLLSQSFEIAQFSKARLEALLASPRCEADAHAPRCLYVAKQPFVHGCAGKTSRSRAQVGRR